jgi:uncharacterized protein YacL
MNPPLLHRAFAALAAAVSTAWVAEMCAAPHLPEVHARWLAISLGLVVGYLVARGTLPRCESPEAELVVDTSALLDGRLGDLLETGIVSATLVVPQAVIGELQGLADGDDKPRRARGRRGLELLTQLREHRQVRLVVDDRALREYAGKPVDERLIALAVDRGARLLTGDFNLNQVARTHGVAVVNLNDVARAMRPACSVGDRLELDVKRPGDQSGQGVGHLEDGTMVVVEGACEHVGRRVVLTVTSVTQSSAGRMIFGRCQGPVDA